jgi:4-hydroxy-2-oxoheptanedioate aldolase
VVAQTGVCFATAVTQSSLSERVRAGETVYGGWAVAPSPVSASVLARGLDYVVIDLQHGTATESDLPAFTTAIRLAGATPLGRVRYAHPADR